jgi:hypothetical protein
MNSGANLKMQTTPKPKTKTKTKFYEIVIIIFFEQKLSQKITYHTQFLCFLPTNGIKVEKQCKHLETALLT